MYMNLMIFDQVGRHPLLAEVALSLRVELLVVRLEAALGHGLVADRAERDVPRAVSRVHAVVDHGNVPLAETFLASLATAGLSWVCITSCTERGCLSVTRFCYDFPREFRGLAWAQGSQCISQSAGGT